MNEHYHNRHGEDGATIWIQGIVKFLIGAVILSWVGRLAKLWWTVMTKYEVKNGELILKSKRSLPKPPEDLW